MAGFSLFKAIMDTGYVSKCDLLAQQIISLLCKGINLNADVVHYINSTFGYPSLQELKEIITDEGNCERDSLLELIFYPDEKIQMDLEYVIESNKFKKDDAEKVKAYLSTVNPKIDLLFPDGKKILKVPFPQSVIDNFVVRLNIYTKTDYKILDTINTYVCASDQSLVKVKLRNRRFDETENKVNFLCMFFESNLPASSYFFECLDFIIEFFNELTKDNDIFNSLVQKRFFCSNSIKKAAALTGQLEKKNFEILMTQNVKIPYLNIAEYKKKIELIDLICMSVFRKTSATASDHYF
jgi:hypothetical protein